MAPLNELSEGERLQMARELVNTTLRTLGLTDYDVLLHHKRGTAQVNVTALNREIDSCLGDRKIWVAHEGYEEFYRVIDVEIVPTHGVVLVAEHRPAGAA